MNVYKPTRNQRLAIFAIVFAFFFAFMGIVIQHASAAPQSASMCSYNNPDGSCWYGPSRSAKKFRNGYFAHSAGITFAHPKMTRNVFVAKIKAKLDGNAALRDRVAAYQTSLGRTACTDNTCLANNAWKDITRRINCIGRYYPTTAPSSCTATAPDSAGFLADITKTGLQRAGSVVFCGGAVVIGVIGAVGSDGTASPALVATWGGLGCGWAFWSSF